MLKVTIMRPPQSMPCSQYKWFLTFEDDRIESASGGRLGSLFVFVCKPTQRQIRRKKKIAVRAIRRHMKSTQGGEA